MGTHTKITRRSLAVAVAANQTMSGTLRALGMNVNGGGFTRLKKKIADCGINTEHWLGYGHLKGRQAYNKGQGKPLREVMVRHSTYQRGHLKRRLIEDRILDHKCAVCGLGSEWQNEPIVLVLDHINGVNNDHRLKNLRLLCPNCNSQTPTFSGRNVKH